MVVAVVQYSSCACCWSCPLPLHQLPGPALDFSRLLTCTYIGIGARTWSPPSLVESKIALNIPRILQLLLPPSSLIPRCSFLFTLCRVFCSTFPRSLPFLSADQRTFLLFYCLYAFLPHSGRFNILIFFGDRCYPVSLFAIRTDGGDNPCAPISCDFNSRRHTTVSSAHHRLYRYPSDRFDCVAKRKPWYLVHCD